MRWMKGIRKGFSLVEVGIALAVGAVVVGAVVVTGAGALSNGKVERAVREIGTIEAGVASWVHRTGNTGFTGVSMTALSDANAIPTALGTAGNNPFGGDYTVSGTASSYTVTVTAVPNAAVRDALNGTFGKRATVNTPASYPGSVTVAFGG